MKELFRNKVLVVEFDERTNEVVVRNGQVHGASVRIREKGTDLNVSSSFQMVVSVESSGSPAIRVKQF